MDNKIGIPITQGEGLPQAVTSALPASASVSGSTGLSCELSCELRTFITSIHVLNKKEDPSKQWTITKLGKRIKIPFKWNPGVLLWRMYWEQNWLQYGACSHLQEKTVWGRWIGTISLHHVLRICLLRNLCVWKILSWCGKYVTWKGWVCLFHGPRSAHSCWQTVWRGRQLGFWGIQRERVPKLIGFLLCHLAIHPSPQPAGQCDSHSGVGLVLLILPGNPSQTYSVSSW